MPSFLLITSFGLGHLRPAPGTWGSLLTIVFAALLLAFGLDPIAHPWAFHAAMLVVFIIFCAACIRDGDTAEARFLRKDPSHVTADETAGQVLPLLFLPASAWATNSRALFTLVLAFLAFRVLDIIKPWPANRLQRVPSGWGILLDDLVAGVLAAGIVQVAVRWVG